MALRLRALVALAEDLASVPSTHVAAHNALKLEFFGKFTPSLGLCRHQHMQVPYMKVKCSHTFKKKSSKKRDTKAHCQVCPETQRVQV